MNKTHPILIIQQHNITRNNLAKRIRELMEYREKLGKDLYRACLKQIKQENRKAYYSGDLLKPSAYNMRRLASINLLASREPVREIRSEYYSYCGHEDYQAQLRYAAKWNAVEYFQAYKQLSGLADYCQPSR